MSEPIYYVDRSTIRPGKFAELQGTMTELAEFVRANEPQLLSYAFFLDVPPAHMTVVAVHPDNASLEFHMDVAGERFRKFADLIEMESIDVYGPLSETLRERLCEKAEMLGRGTVTVHTLHAGFARFDGDA